MSKDIPTVEDNSYMMHNLHHRDSDSKHPIWLDFAINDIPVKMEFDTGASLSIISHQTYKQIAKNKTTNPIKESSVVLKTYTGESLKVLGEVSVCASYGGKKEELYLLVVEGNGPNLMGRDWLKHFRVSFGEVNSLDATPLLNEVLGRHSEVFKEELGTLQGVKVTLHAKADAIPRYFKARPVPFALKAKVETELDRLQEQGIISPVQFSNWAAPIVPVRKRDGSIQVCGDYKITVNQATHTETYPLPRVEELFSKLSGGKQFSKLDMSQAYLQLEIDDASKEYVTVNTTKGLYQYNRLPFGVASAPAIFQRCMDTLLQGLPGVSVYLDDVLVTGASVEEHLCNLDKVLGKLRAAGLRLNKSKCKFVSSQVEFLGHIIDENGLHPTDDKIKAIHEAPQPRNVSELKSFLGLINYYGKFLRSLSCTLAPLYSLLQKRKRWTWGTDQKRAFEAAKEALQADTLLVHYDPSKPLLVACDASLYGIGAVLSHIMDNGDERPVHMLPGLYQRQRKITRSSKKKGWR